MSNNQTFAKVIFSLFLIIIGCLSPGFPTMAEDELDRRTKEIAHKLRCPTCQAMSVKESDAGLSNNMKLKIRDMLEEGKSEEEILKFFEDRYGEWILRLPGKKGFNLLLWILPSLIISISVVTLFVSLGKNKGRQPSDGKLKPISEEERSRIERDLRDINS